jgi:hypothetical protein
MLRASAAHAGPVEQMTQMSFQPGGQTAVLRYTNGGEGLFYSHDGAKTFQLACMSSIDPTLNRGGPTMITGNGTILMGTLDGMYEAEDGGCGWSRVAQFDKTQLSDFAVHPTDKNVMFAVSWNSAAGAQNGILRRDAGGKWSEVGTRDGSLITRIQAVDVGGNLRFYESASRGAARYDGGPPQLNYMIRVSDDDGMTWKEHMFHQAGNAALRLEAVDPTDPDRLVVSLERDAEQDSIMLSDDQGATFTEYLKISDIGGVAMAPDGRIWIGDKGDPMAVDPPVGLWAAPGLDQPAQKIGDYVVQCLAYEPAQDTLYVCQHWSLGTVSENGEFMSLLKMQEAPGFLECPGQDIPAACKMQLCGAYCGPGHFAQAPLCEAYTDPTCGPAVAENVGDTSGRAISGGTGTSGLSGATSSDPMVGGADGGKRKRESSRGCSCSALERVPRSLAAWPIMLGGVFALLLRRTRGA